MAVKRIHSKGHYRQVEYVTAGTITPGMVVTLGSAGTIVAHATEGGRAEALVAAEDALQGRPVGTNYTTGERATCLLPNKGSEVNVLVEDGQDIAIGDQLISAGNGKLKEGSDLESGETLTQVLFIATEACDLTGSNTSDTLCRARVL